MLNFARMITKLYEVLASLKSSQGMTYTYTFTEFGYTVNGKVDAAIVDGSPPIPATNFKNLDGLIADFFATLDAVAHHAPISEEVYYEISDGLYAVVTFEVDKAAS